MNEINPNEPVGQPSYKDAKAQAKAAKAYAKATRPFYKKKRFIFLGVVVAVVMVSVASGGGDETATADDVSTAGVAEAGQDVETSEQVEEEAAPGLKTAVRDGKFEFTVKSFECGEDKIGSGFMAEKAQGQFCVATVKVENIGDEAQMFDGSSQYLYDNQDREFAASTEAAIVLPASQSFLEDINPGNTVTGKVIWDVPSSGFKADHLKLHDSMFSDGVEVALK
jgi:hypothetical protein